jgi:hypothetical protein
MSKRHNRKGRPAARQPLSEDALAAISHRLALADTTRLNEQEIDKHTAAMMAAVDSVEHEFHPPAYNVLTHYYRIANAVAQAMGAKEFMAITRRASEAIGAYYNMETKGPMPAHLVTPVLKLVNGLIAFLPEVPLRLWLMAEESSMEYVTNSLVDRYMDMPDWAQSIAYEVLYLGKDPAETAAKHNQEMGEAADAILSVACMAHILTMDGSIDFPKDLAVALSIREQIKVKVLTLQATKQTVAAIEARQKLAA